MGIQLQTQPMVAITHTPESGETSALFLWDFLPPKDTYVIAHPNLLIEADKRLPLRPARLIIEDAMNTESTNAAEELFGETIAEGLRLAPQLGLLMVRYTPNYKNVLSFALLQSKDKLTLPYIKRGNEAQVNAITKYIKDKKIT